MWLYCKTFRIIDSPIVWRTDPHHHHHHLYILYIYIRRVPRMDLLGSAFSSLCRSDGSLHLMRYVSKQLSPWVSQVIRPNFVETGFYRFQKLWTHVLNSQQSHIKTSQVNKYDMGTYIVVEDAKLNKSVILNNKAFTLSSSTQKPQQILHSVLSVDSCLRAPLKFPTKFIKNPRLLS